MARAGVWGGVCARRFALNYRLPFSVINKPIHQSHAAKILYIYRKTSCFEVKKAERFTNFVLCNSFMIIVVLLFLSIFGVIEKFFDNGGL